MRRIATAGVAITSLVAAILGVSGASAHAAPGPAQQKSCVLIDTDLDFDDLMAIPAIVANKYVAGIITTEGATLAPQAASALKKMMVQPGTARSIPVVIGASYPGTRDLTTMTWVPPIRAALERANDLLSGPLTPSPSTPASHAGLPSVVRSLVSTCASVQVLVIGPYLSFARYSPAIRAKVSRVVSMGKPISKSQVESGDLSFNCEYDLASCAVAYRQMKGLHPVWVDIPRTDPNEYTPSLAMVTALEGSGLPGSLKQALLSNLSTWEPTSLPPGAKSLLWDQTAAIYVLNRDLFTTVGDHLEPRIPAAQVRELWTQAVNNWSPADGS